MEPAEYALMDAAEEAMWWYRALHRRLLDALADAEGPVLDAGCGTGGFLALLARERPDLEAVGIDFFPAAAARAAAKSGRPAACGSVQTLPFADGAFGAVVSADVLCHRSLEPGAALDEFARVLRPGGKLVLNLPAFEWLKSAHDIRVKTARRSTAGGLKRLLQDHDFAPVRVGYWNSLLLPLMVIERKVLARKEDSPSDVKAFPPLLDSALFVVTEVERKLCLPLPAGGSVFTIARRT